MRYAAQSFMEGLLACPFCRHMAPEGEATLCPECGIALVPFEKLGPSPESVLEEVTPPEHETLPWTYWARGRGFLLLVACLGLGAFFAPWAYERAPELRDLSGFDFALLLRWMGAPLAAWLVMIPLVASRRTIHRMRGARVAVGFLAGIVLVTVAIRWSTPPPTTRLYPVATEWGWGLFATGFLGLLALAGAIRYGGSVPPPKAAEKGREVDIAASRT